MIPPPRIHDRGRGPELVGTRVTVYDIIPYLEFGEHPAVIAAEFDLGTEEVAALIRYIEEHKEEVAAICTSEHGKTLAESRNDFGRGIENVEHAAGIPSLLMGQSLDDVAGGIDCQTHRQPMGVFAAITPAK